MDAVCFVGYILNSGQIWSNHNTFHICILSLRWWKIQNYEAFCLLHYRLYPESGPKKHGHQVLKFKKWFFSFDESSSIVRIHHIFFIQSSVDGHLDCFHVLAIVHNDAVTIGVQKSFQINVFIFFKYIPGSETAGSYGSSTFSFFEESPYSYPWGRHQFVGFGVEEVLKGNIVDDTVLTSRWQILTRLSAVIANNVYKCQTTGLYVWNYYNIVCQPRFNKKKFK